MNDQNSSPAKPDVSRRQFWTVPGVLAVPAVAILASTQTAEAQTGAAAPAGQKIGTIQVQGALFNTKDGQKAAAALESQMGTRKKDLDQKQSELRDLQEKLTRGENTMSDTAKQDLARTIDLKDKSYKREMEDAQAELDEAKRKLFDDLSQKMRTVLNTYATNHGYAMLMDVSNPNTPIVFAAASTDVTKDIVEMYDKMQPPTPSSSPVPAPKAPTTPVKKF